MKLRKKYIVLAAAAVIVAAVAAGVLMFISGGDKREDLRYLRQAEYTSVFLSMVPYEDMEADAIGVDFFSFYLAQDAVTVPRHLRSAGEVKDYLKAALGSGNEVGFVHLELIPFSPGSFGFLSDLAAAHPGTTFKILLNAPSMGYWTAQGEGRAKKQLDSYKSLVKLLLPHGNVEVYFAGAEDWLILNPGSYSAPLVASRDITRHLALLTFCDSNYRLTEENYMATFEGLGEKIAYARTAPAPADLSGWRLVFFGDSVIGNYSDSTSIPSAVAYLSGCEAYNLGVGGTPAAFAGPDRYSFTVLVDSFLERKAVTLPESFVCPRDMAAYYEKEKEQDGRRLCFVVNYGLNDYFNGSLVENDGEPLDISTYAGALRSGVRKLRAAYPEAAVILAAPNYVEYFTQGQEKQGAEGGCLTDYVAAAERVAREESVIFMNNYYDLGIDSSNSRFYLADGCHPGDNGRFMYAQALIRLISSHFPQE